MILPKKRTCKRERGLQTKRSACMCQSGQMIQSKHRGRSAGAVYSRTGDRRRAGAHRKKTRDSKHGMESSRRKTHMISTTRAKSMKSILPHISLVCLQDNPQKNQRGGNKETKHSTDRERGGMRESLAVRPPDQQHKIPTAGLQE